MDDGYSSSTDMLSDGSKRKYKSGSGRTPRFKFRTGRRPKKLSEASEVGGNFLVGMLIIFPVLALLTMAVPMVMLSIIGVSGLAMWMWTRSFWMGLIFMGAWIGMILLGFVSLGILMMLLN